MESITRFAHWLVGELRRIVVNSFCQAVTSWVCEQFARICEALAARIAIRVQQAEEGRQDSCTLQTAIFTRLGESVSDFGAKLIEHAETLTADDAVLLFADAVKITEA